MTAVEEPTTVKRLRLFVSYARADLPAVLMVREGLETLNHQIWIDQKLRPGQAWWFEILERIRDCDAMIIAVSPSLLDSEAASREWHYARALGKPLLPVLVAPMSMDLLPTELAPLQLVDYTSPSPVNAFRLAAALAGLPPATPLPDPLPPAPAVPLSYMAGIADKLQAASLSLEDQLSLVGQLRPALERPKERDDARELFGKLLKRRDLYHAVWTQVDPLLRAGEPDPPAQPAPPPAGETAAEDDAAPGWYPDPSHRHRLRWFDGDWTQYASDGGPVLSDPDF